MKKWILKAIIQKSISFFPYNHNINYLFQKYVTKGVHLTDEYFYDRLEHSKNHLLAFSSHFNNQIPKITLEIGTGWYPVVPVGFFLAGSEQIYSLDTSFLIRKDRIKITLTKFYESFNTNLLSNFIPYNLQRVGELEAILKNFDKLSLSDILRKLHINYSVGDARKLQLADNSIDLINSNNTFEHIYRETLKEILIEFKRVVKKSGGMMSHFIDMSDHFAHFDKSITIYNYLTFSDRKWKWIDNSIQPQNRLRIFDYKRIYKELLIPINEETLRPGSVEILNSLTLDKKFTNKNNDELAISHCHLISIFD